MPALHRFLGDSTKEVVGLLNMCENESDRSRSHGITKDWIRKQAIQLAIALVQSVSDRESYETVFKKEISKLKKRGAQAGILGDIY